jgi:hypothetical protein
MVLREAKSDYFRIEIYHSCDIYIDARELKSRLFRIEIPNNNLRSFKEVAKIRLF